MFVTMDRNLSKVLVICPTKGKSLHLSRTVNSVLSQDYINLFLCIVDDSGDENLDLSNKFFGDNIILLKNNTNIGQAASLNSCIKKYSNFDFYALIDDDDEWVDSSKISLQIDFLNSNTHFLFSSTMSFISINKTKYVYEPENSIDSIIKLNISPKEIFSFNPIVHSSVLISSRVFKDGLFYDDKLQRAQDIEFWYRILSKYPSSLFFVETPCVILNKVDDNFLYLKLKKSFKDSLAMSLVKKKHNIYDPIYDNFIIDFTLKLIKYFFKISSKKLYKRLF